jgi:hypothetical protein
MFFGSDMLTCQIRFMFALKACDQLGVLYYYILNV